MKFTIHQQFSSIVWVAAVNPMNLTPDWFKHYEILSPEDCEQANVAINNNSICSDFGWFEIIASDKKIHFKLAKAGLEQDFVDMVSSVISVMGTVKTYGLGMNTKITYKVNSFDDYHKVGDELIPKGKLYEASKSTLIGNPEVHIGMASCRIAFENSTHHKSNDEPAPIGDNKFLDTIYLDISGINEKENGIDYGILFSFNHHIASVKEQEIEFTEQLPSVIINNFISDIANNQETADNIMRNILS